MNNMKLHTGKRREGFILVLTLFTILILAGLIIAFTNMTAIDTILVKNHIYSSNAYYIAEAGIADAINQIRISGPLADTQWQETFPASTSNTYDVSVSQGSTVITATGLAAASNFSRVIEAKIKVSGTFSPYDVTIVEWKEVTQ
jgi:Tfp pilus assembly protein PilX